MVEFDSADEANTELLQKLKHLDVRVESAERKDGGLCQNGCWKSLKWKATLNHIGLLVSLSLYCGVGGLIFRQLERPAEVERLQYLKNVVKTKRENFINVIINNTDVNNLDQLLKFELAKYEEVSMPKWNMSRKDPNNADIAALEAITNAILKEVKEAQNNKPKVLQIVIYESSV
uniref:Uncharacterized protein n=1 Tax=Stomoxys calcitrans TaxID=35570 RepID=A0A1I8P8D3_STOCA